jgi:hypothetical protein
MRALTSSIPLREALVEQDGDFPIGLLDHIPQRPSCSKSRVGRAASASVGGPGAGRRGARLAAAPVGSRNHHRTAWHWRTRGQARPDFGQAFGGMANVANPDNLTVSAPLGWQHINLAGDYLWAVESSSVQTGSGRCAPGSRHRTGRIARRAARTWIALL